MCAKELHEAIETIVQAELAQYREAKKEDGDVPVVPSGDAPPPQVPTKLHELPEPERREIVASTLRAVRSGV